MTDRWNETGRAVDPARNLGLSLTGPMDDFLIEQTVAAHHYLRKYPDPRCMCFNYSVHLGETWVGCLVFGRPQAGKLFKGPLTYGSVEDVESGKARLCRWEVLNLARVWFSPAVQRGGCLHRPELLPGFVDRKGVWRSTLASTVIRAAIHHVRIDYLVMYPPVFFRKWHIRCVLSYCDTRLHRGTIYRESGFSLASRNREGIETWAFEGIEPPTAEDDAVIRRIGRTHPRSVKKRNAKSFRLPPGFFSDSLLQA